MKDLVESHDNTVQDMEVDLLNCLSMVAILDFCTIFKIVALLKYANISIETNYAISRLKSMKNMKLVHLNITNKSESSFFTQWRPF